MDLKKE